mgnify:CR=1 FL=1
MRPTVGSTTTPIVDWEGGKAPVITKAQPLYQIAVETTAQHNQQQSEEAARNVQIHVQRWRHSA